MPDQAAIMPKITDILNTMDYGVAPEGNEHVMRWLDQNHRRFGHFIDGKFTTPPKKSAQQIAVMNPAMATPHHRLGRRSGR